MTLRVSEGLIVAKTTLQRPKDRSFKLKSVNMMDVIILPNQQFIIHWCSHCKTCVPCLLLRSGMYSPSATNTTDTPFMSAAVKHSQRNPQG